MQLRVTLSSMGVVKVSSIPLPAVALVSLFPESLSSIITCTKPTFHVFVSPVTTEGSLFTRHKTTNRKVYDTVRNMIPSESKKHEGGFLLQEILLVNPDGNIMEGSITTPYFNRSGSWVTPFSSCLGNLGTTRRYALEQGLCQEGNVSKEEIRVGESIVLSNGARGFGWGIIEVLRPPLRL